jgi:FkbM family methyltransferase
MILNLDYLQRKYGMNFKGVIHIGAHYGEEFTDYKRLNIPKVSYFEPVKKTFEILKTKVGDGANLFNYALGDDNREIEMYIEESDRLGASSILKPNTTLITEQKFNYGEVVQMKRLDDVDFDFSDYNFINIDVQGYEFEVLKGSVKTLEHIDYIICEINRIIPEKAMVYENCVDVSIISEFLSKFGFKLVEVDWAGISWGDGLYIK